MKVLEISLRYQGGGAERCARELLERLPAAGVPTDLWVTERAPSDPPGVMGLRHPWEKHLAFLEAYPPWTDWRHRGAIQKLDALKPADFDVVHFHTLHSGCVSIKAVQRLCQRMPVVWTLHDEWAATGGNCYDLRGKISPHQVKEMASGFMRHVPYHPYHENPRFRGLRHFLDRWMPQPAVLISPSQYLARLAADSGRFPHVPVKVIHNGVAMLDEPLAAMPRQEARESFAIPPTARVVLMVAADLSVPHKGAALGIEAINKVPAEIDLHVLLMGTGAEPFRGRIQRPGVTCFVARGDRELARAYRAADVTLVPSLADNFPYVALESFACGTPLVAFHVGGLAEMIGDSERGLLAKPYDVEQLGAELSRLLADPPLRELLGTRGLAWVRRECTMDNYVRATVAAYEEATVAARRSPRAGG